MNQCDGCREGRSVDASGNHRMGEGAWPDLMVCQASRYKPTALERTEFVVWFNGCEWCASVDRQVIATGQTPVSAVIAAELRVRRQP